MSPEDIAGSPSVRVLVVDDEPNLVELVQGYLRQEGYAVEAAANGVQALELTRAHRPDVVVLDVMLPGLDGVEVCRQLRQFSDAYVLMLTARAEEIDKIIGLSVGADDYLTKPFSPRELVARVKAMLRRPRRGGAGVPGSEPASLRFGEIVIDEARHQVTKAGAEIALTAREFALLLRLAQHPGRVFTRGQLLQAVWGDEFYDDHVVDVHVSNLRHKLEDDAASPRLLQTVRGVGYRFRGPTG
jgi:two-component system alkaline phosphatase synthesis response regulator PhoP